eukprot:g24136.t1
MSNAAKLVEFGAKFVQLRSTWEPNAQSIPLTRSALSIWLFRSRPSKPTVCNARIATLPPKAREVNVSDHRLNKRSLPRGSPLTKYVCHIIDKFRWQSPRKQKGSKKGAKKAAPKVGAKSRAQKLSYSPDSQGDAPAAEAKAPAAKAASQRRMEALARLQCNHNYLALLPECEWYANCGFVNDQPEKGGARTQDEVLKDLAELSKISNAAKAGLLGADAVLRLDNNTPPGPILNGEEDD